MKVRHVALKGHVTPGKFRGQKRVVIETLKKLGAVGSRMIPLGRVIKAAGPRLKLHRGVTPANCVKAHVRELRGRRMITELRKAA